MPSVTLFVAGRGAGLAQGGASAAGHMWFQLNDGRGNSIIAM